MDGEAHATIRYGPARTRTSRTSSTSSTRHDRARRRHREVMRLGRMAPLCHAAGADQGEHMPIFTMEIDKRAVMAFSGNY